MNRRPLLLIGAGLLTLSMCWVVVFAMTVTPTPSSPLVVVMTPEPAEVSAQTSPVSSTLAIPTLAVASTASTGPTLTPTGPLTARPTVYPTASPEPTPTKPPPTPSPLPTPDPIPTPAATPSPEPTEPPLIALTCANGVDNGGGTGTICEVVIGPESATVLECHGAAGDPRASCSLTTYSGRVTSVEACNGTANGGGATLRCSVTGVGTGSTLVSLCVGTGAGGTLVGMTCEWSGSSGVTVSACNGSGNGGGALIVCSVD